MTLALKMMKLVATLGPTSQSPKAPGQISRNIAASGKLSSDRTAAEYARDIWKVKPCHVDVEEDA